MISPARFTAYSTAFFLLLSFVWSLVSGKDVNWDFINYHLYGPYLLLEDRLGVDYFAASLQSYLNPTIYLPLYWMIQAKWHSIAIGAILTAVHAANLALVWRLASLVVADRDGRLSWLPWLATALAFVSPLFLTTLGSTFADPVTSLLILGGLHFLAMPAQGPARLWWAVAAGLLFGVAAGLKLTNGLFLACALAALALTEASQGRDCVRRFLAFGVAAGAGLLLSHGYWSWLLWREFGNPLFPMANGVFASPDFPPVTYRDERFLGRGILGALTLPWRMSRTEPWIYAENAAPDAEVGALALVLLAAAAAAVLVRTGRFAFAPPRAGHPLRLLTAFFVIGFFVWALLSAIGRYALPLWLLAGVLIVGWSQVLGGARGARIAGAVVLVLQCFLVATIGNLRWTPTEWTADWASVVVPESLRREPATYLIMNVQSYALIVPYLHPGAAAVNLAGQYSQPAGERMTPRFRALLERDASRIKVVMKDMGPVKWHARPRWQVDMDAALSTYGLRLSPARCEHIYIQFVYVEKWTSVVPPEWLSEDVASSNAASFPDGDRLRVCGVERLAPEEYAAKRAEMARVDRAFAAIERACGARLAPPDGQTVHGYRGWQRYYFNSLNMLITDGEQIIVKPFRGLRNGVMGTLDEWSGSTPPQVCPPIPPAVQLLD